MLNASTGSAITIQGRVIYALMLREVHTIYGNSKLGYLWVIIQNIFGIGVFWVIREFMGFNPPHGMSSVMFLLTGFFVWNIFSDTLNKCMSAVNGNNALLTYPQVTVLDLLLSRSIVILATQTLTAIILFGIACLLGQGSTVAHYGSFFSVILLTPILGLGCGAFFAGLSYYIPLLEKIIPMALRILFFFSGVFFQINFLPSNLQEYILYNPLVHYIEWLRMSMSYTFLNSSLDIGYAISVTYCILVLGLLIERHVRGRFLP